MRRRWLWAVLIVVMVAAVPIVNAEELATVAGSSLGFYPALGLEESHAFQGYVSEANQLYVMVVEVPRANNLKTMDDFAKLLAADEEDPNLTVVSKQRDIFTGVNCYLVQYAIHRDGMEVAQWIYVMEGEKTFGQVVISMLKPFAEEHREELMAMLQSFRWMGKMRPVLTYSFTLPENWELAEGDEELAIYAVKSDGEDDSGKPAFFVTNFKTPIEAEMRETFLKEFFMHEETKSLLQSEEMTIDGEEAALHFIENNRGEGLKSINMICLIYTEKTTYAVYAVQSDVITPEFFKAVIRSWALLK